MLDLKPQKDDITTICSTMGCRTYNGYNINWREAWKNALFDVIKTGKLDHKVLRSPRQKDGRGNISPVTIILPTLAMEADRNVDKFMKLLDKKITEAKEILFERFDWQCSQSFKSAKFMFENNSMYGYIPEEGIKSALKHGTLVIGQLGLAETLHLLVGCDQTSEEGMKLAKEIEQLFKTRCAEFKAKYKLNIGVYYTPAENLCYTAMLKFKEKYGIIENVSDHDFFTNSMHVPVWNKKTPFEKIDLESQLTGYSNAGCITYIELDASAEHNTKALEDLVIYAMEKDIPYFAINVPSDTCLSCGYQGEINDVCPECGGGKIQHLRRVTGYLTGDYITSFNKGKCKEVEMRVKHNGIEV
jgi:ribonucleoside-triphosphate reductase